MQVCQTCNLNVIHTILALCNTFTFCSASSFFFFLFKWTFVIYFYFFQYDKGVQFIKFYFFVNVVKNNISVIGKLKKNFCDRVWKLITQSSEFSKCMSMNAFILFVVYPLVNVDILLRGSQLKLFYFVSGVDVCALLKVFKRQFFLFRHVSSADF